MNQIKVMLVDDDESWIYVMTSFLNSEEDIKIVEVATSKEEAVHKASINDIDIILMDISFSENNIEGIYASLEITKLTKVKIIMLTNHDFEESVLKSFISGAVNYVEKKNYKQLPDIIRIAYEGNSPEEILGKSFADKVYAKQLNVLTKTEKEIFHMIKDGYTSKEIVENNRYGIDNFKNHITRILKKLKIRNYRNAVYELKLRAIEKKGSEK